MIKEHKFILQTISYRWEYLPVVIGDTWQLSKQVCKLFFQMRVHVYSLLGLTESGRKVFFLRVQEGRLPPRALSCFKRLKESLPL